MDETVIVQENRNLTKYLVWTFILGWGMQAIGIYVPGTYSIMISLCMFAPMIAVLICNRGLSRTKTGIGWKLGFKRNWRWFLISLILPTILTVLGGIFYFLIFQDQFRPEADYFKTILSAAGSTQISVETVIMVQMIEAVTIGAVINMFFAIGEEVGWRGYMTPALVEKLGSVKGKLLAGLIWSAFHWPLILFAGYEYGTGYFGAPFTGCLAMCLFTTAMGIFLSFVYEQTNCIWVPALMHGAINAICALPIYFMPENTTNMLLGPTLAGVISVLPALALGLYILILTRKIKK